MIMFLLIDSFEFVILQFMVNGVIGQIGAIVQNIVLEKAPKKKEQENVTVNGVWIMKV